MASNIFKIDDTDNIIPDKLSELKNNTITICNMLNCDVNDFNVMPTLSKISKFINSNYRFFYSEISNFIFELNEYARGNFYTNLDNLVDTMFAKDETEEKVCRAVIKLYDHANLAASQYNKLKWTDEEFTRMFNENILSVKSDIEQQKQETTSRLISLVAIFTAMSFLVFGGISSLGNIFSGVLQVSILKLMMIGCIWGLCMLNLVFVFVYFVAKAAGTNIKTNCHVKANFIQRYPFTCWANLVIFTMLLLCGWLYFIDTQGIKNQIAGLNSAVRNGLYIAGFAGIGLLFFLLARYLINKCK